MTTNHQLVLDKYKELKERDRLTESGEKENSLHWYFSSFNRFAVALKGNKHALSMLVVYLCMRIEQAQRRTLYCDMIKRYNIKKEVAHDTLDSLKLYRPQFFETYKKLAQEPYENVTKTSISAETMALMSGTRKVRNAIVHGDDSIQGDDGKITDSKKATTIITLLEYAIELNKEVLYISKFQPFGDLRGFKGRAEPNDEAISKQILERLEILPKPKIKQPKCLAKCLQK